MNNRVANQDPIVFWIFGPWDTHATKGDLHRCDVTRDTIVVIGLDPGEIPVNDIEGYQVAELGDGRGAIPYVAIRVKGKTETLKIFPANPFAPAAKNLLPWAETRAFVAALDFVKGVSSSGPDPSPYVRQAVFDNRLDLATGRLAGVSPLEYRRLPRPRPIIVALSFLLVALLLTGAVLLTLYFVDR